MESLGKGEMAYELITRLALKVKSRITPRSKSAQLFCPFHEEKNASMFVNMEKGIFHCFSCHRKGTINALSKEITGSTIYKFLDLKYDEFQEHSKVLYKQEFVDYDKIPSVLIKESDRGEARGAALGKSPVINSFLRRRGLTQEIAKSFRMYHLENVVRYNGTPYINRVCIPIYEGGRLLSVEGRADSLDNPLKVMYPKGSTVSTLYEYEKLDREKPLWIVEGLMDLAFLRRDPYFANSSCIFGANLTPRQKHLLKKFKEVLYIKENDAAGDGCVKELQTIDGIRKGYLKIPKTLKGVKIKDIGDFVKAGWTVQRFREEKNWIEVGLVKLH